MLSAISGNGRYVVFLSDTSMLVQGDTNGFPDVFRKDCLTGEVVRASVDCNGAQTNGPSNFVSISDDGRFVAFASRATNLVAGDTNNSPDVFRKDLQTGAIVRASVDSAGNEGNKGSYDLALSADGRYVAFYSDSSNFVSDDNNGVSDIFRKDLQTGAIFRLSVDSAGIEANKPCIRPSISGTGEFVAFFSPASNLVPEDTNGVSDVFLASRNIDSSTDLSFLHGYMNRISVDSDGGQANGYSYSPSISPDGRYVAFTSKGTNFTWDGAYWRNDIFRKDLLTGTTARISAVSADGDSRDPSVCSTGAVAFSSDASNIVQNDTNEMSDIFFTPLSGNTVRISTDAFGGQANNLSVAPSITSNGAYVAFASRASNLVSGDTNGSWDVFRKNVQTGEIVRVSVDATGAQANGASEQPVISPDGRYVVFISDASNLVSGDTNGVADVFRKDLQTGEIVRVSTGQYGLQADGKSSSPSINQDGRYVTFASSSSNLLPSGSTQGGNIFRKDLQTGTVVLVSSDSHGKPSENGGFTEFPSISLDGRYVAFLSSAFDLVPGDTNGTPDIFLKDLQTGEIKRVSVDLNGSQTQGYCGMLSMSGNGQYVAFDSNDANLVSNDTNGVSDVFVADLNAYPQQSAPSTSLQTTPYSYGTDVWFKENPSILLASSQPGTTYWQWDSTETAGWTTYVSEFSAPEGAHTLYYYSVNTSGVKEATRSRAIKVDTSAPTNPTTSSSSHTIGESSTDPTVDIGISGATDSISGVDGYSTDWSTAPDTVPDEFRDLDKSAVSVTSPCLSGGDWWFHLRTVDAAGNWSSAVHFGPLKLATAPGQGNCRRVSVDSAGGQANSYSDSGAISADGQYIVFTSLASNLVPNDTNGAGDVFRKDLKTGEVVRVSVDSQGAESSGWSYSPSISADGRYVAFFTEANNLLSDGGNSSYDILRKDLATGEVLRVSANSEGVKANNMSGAPSISADGNRVAFLSDASNLASGDTNGVRDVFCKNVETGEVTRVSVGSNDNQASGNSGDFGLSISADGRYVAFESNAPDLVPGDTNASPDIFRKDLQTGELVRVSVNAQGEEGIGWTKWQVTPSISADGRYVLFVSYASNLVPNDTNGNADVFRKDLQTGEIVRVSVDAAGGEAPNGAWDDLTQCISADGRYAVFTAFGPNFSPNANAVFRKDLETGALELVSVNAASWNDDKGCTSPVISADGRFVAFASEASNLVSDDTNLKRDVFVADLSPKKPAPITTFQTSPSSPDGTNGWFKTAPSVTLTSSEPGTTYYQWDSTETARWVAYSEQVSAPEGTHMLYYRSENTDGVSEETHSCVIKVDSGAPVTTLAIAGPKHGDDPVCVTGASAFSLTSTDTGSGVAASYYRVDNGEWQLYSDTFTLSTAGKHTVEYYGVDKAGNSSAVLSKSVVVDETAPITSSELSGTLGSNDWYTSDVTVTLSSSDNDGGAGVAVTEYSLDGGVTWNAYTAPFMLTGEGETNILYCSTDYLGNKEETKTTSVRIDTTSPAAFALTAPANNATTQLAKPTFSWSASADAVSGLAGYRLYVDGALVVDGIDPGATSVVPRANLTDGTHTWCVKAIDKAGNERASGTYTLKVNATVPVTMLTVAPATPNGANGWYKTAPRVILKNSETGAIYYQWDSTAPGGWTKSPSTATSIAAPQGAHTLYYYSVDKPGNVEETKHYLVKVDSTVPTNPTLASPSHAPGDVSNDPTIDITLFGATDAASGVDGYSFNWSKAPSTPDAAKDLEGDFLSFTSPSIEDGLWYLNLRTVDKAGNWSAATHLGPFTIDTKGPTTTISSVPSAPNGASGWYKTAPKITLKRSEVGSTYYQWDSTETVGWAESTSTATTVTAPQGAHTLYYYSVDKASNSETMKSAFFKVDSTAPANPKLTSTSHTVGGTSSDATIDIALSDAVDAASGVDGFSYTWTKSVTTAADTTKDLGGSAATLTSPALANGVWYLHLRTVDKAGNWSTTVHLGPFSIKKSGGKTA